MYEDWEVVIGVEVHAQISTKSKLFSSCGTSFGAEPNSQVSLVDAAMPGMLPTLNEECVKQAIRTGLGLNAKINLLSKFDRKNYFYADLPQGYQITQYSHPIAQNGHLKLDMKDGTAHNVRINRVHIEQDAGKSIHDMSPDESFIDLNRAGIGLMEIVTEPDMQNAEQVGEFVKRLRSILRYLGTCDGDMEKGSLRCDVNISVRKNGATELGTRTETKNLNSIKHIAKTIEYESQRQIDLILSGGKVDQETRLFNIETGKTKTLRSKEDAHDYRYFPDPDIPNLRIMQQYIDDIANQLPELPEVKKERYCTQYHLSQYDASILTAEKETAVFFEDVMKVLSAGDAKLASNWITAELFGRLNKAGIEIESSPIKPTHIIKLVELINSEVISGKIAKQVFDEMFLSSKDPMEIVKEKGLEQITDISQIQDVVLDIMNANQDKVTQYKAGKDKLFGFFVGQVMAKTKGKANPKIVNEAIKSHLESC